MGYLLYCIDEIHGYNYCFWYLLNQSTRMELETWFSKVNLTKVVNTQIKVKHKPIENSIFYYMNLISTNLFCPRPISFHWNKSHLIIINCNNNLLIVMSDVK